jgi:DNA-directed RNA polymerase subunit M/transcription elongation factor TFIIS
MIRTCNNCNHIIHDTQVEPIKVPLYLLLCQSCQIEEKNNERDKKLNKVLSKRGILSSLRERIKEWLKS